jgi:hypothetical protein
MKTEWKCLLCSVPFQVEGTKKPKTHTCKREKGDPPYNFKLVKTIFTNEELSMVDKFQDKELLKNILNELSKDHIGDDNLKMTTFLCDVSGLSPTPSLRKSIAIKANSAEGKDNLIKTCLKHMPQESCIFLTSATQATIEDDINDKKIIAFSEVNSNREVGANKYLTEVIKQKAEGGTSSIKKDISKGMTEARFDVGEQATINYGTTEIEGDEELGTRFIEGNIKTNYERIKKVNNNTLDSFSDLDKLVNDNVCSSSWIKVGLTFFFCSDKDQFKIALPYAKFLKEQINGQDIFDYNSPRSQRDLKRVLALTCAMAYLHQLQRKLIDHNGNKVLISEPQDLINTLRFSLEFFNQSYTGIDARVMNVLKIMEEIGTEWVARDLIEEKLNLSKNTTIKYCQMLAKEGCLKGIKGSELIEQFGLESYHKSKIYYQRCQKGIKKPLIRCQLSELKLFLEQKTNSDLTPFVIDDNDTKKVSKQRYQITPPPMEISTLTSQIDTFLLTPLYCGKEFFNGSEMLLCGQLLGNGERFVCPDCKEKDHEAN